MSLIINSLPMEYFSAKKNKGDIIDRMKTIVNDSTTHPSLFVIKDDYYDIVCSAVAKCFSMYDNDYIENIFALIVKGTKMGIPF